MPFYIAEPTLNNGKLQVTYFTETGTSSNPGDAKIYRNRTEADLEVLKRGVEASVISIPEQGKGK